MGRKSKKKGGQKGSGKGGNASENGGSNASERDEKGGKAAAAGVTEDELALGHLLNCMMMLRLAELGGDIDETKCADSLKYCEENASKVFADGGAEFRRKVNVQVEKAEKKFVDELQFLKEKGDSEGCLRLFQARKRSVELQRDHAGQLRLLLDRMRSEGMEGKCGDLFHGTLVDDELFAPPPPNPECPVCFLTLPRQNCCTYSPCCGKTICDGCAYAQRDTPGCPYVCSFCRASIAQTDKERIKRTKQRAEVDDPEALYMLGATYLGGTCGVRKNLGKAHELIGRAADLGLPAAHHSLGIMYLDGVGVEKDEKKSLHHLRLAAIGGEVQSRYLLGVHAYEAERQNMELAMKHWIIAAEAGYDDSLNSLKVCYKRGHLPKDVFAACLRAHKAAVDEVKSEQRDFAERQPHDERIAEGAAKTRPGSKDE